jgi:hypothetical protein
MSAARAFRADEVTEDYESSGSILREVPLPVTLQVTAPLSDEELLAFCEANSGLEIESDADGSIRIMTSAGPESSELNQLLATELNIWPRQNRNGTVFGPDLGIRFPDKLCAVLMSPGFLPTAGMSTNKPTQAGQPFFLSVRSSLSSFVLAPIEPPKSKLRWNSG